jgi:PAS fold
MEGCSSPPQVYEQEMANGQIVEVQRRPLAGGGGWVATYEDGSVSVRALASEPG